MYRGDVAIKSGGKAKPVALALAIVSKSEINYSKHELKISNHDFINSRFAFGIYLIKGEYKCRKQQSGMGLRSSES